MNDQRPVGYVSQDFLDGKWSMDHIAASDEGQISRTIPVFTKPPQASEQRQNVTQLVEALTGALEYLVSNTGHGLWRDTVIFQIEEALAAHRRGAQP